MAGIFISYRRADSDGWAGRLRDTLRARFGDLVFQDVDNIADGEIFSEVIDRELQKCNVALVIIGPNWATARDEHGRRLDHEEDWVRTETAMVLNRKIRVIPVLVGGARLPRADELPAELRSLAKRQAREIRSTSWDSDVGLLTSQLEQIVGQRRQLRVWLYALPPLVVLVGIGVFAGSRHFGQPPPSPAPAERTAASVAGGPLQRDEPARAASDGAAPSKSSTSEPPKENPPEIAQAAKPAPAQHTAAPPAGSMLREEPTRAASSVTGPSTSSAGATLKEKQPGIAQPVKAKPLPAPPKEPLSPQASTVPQGSKTLPSASPPIGRPGAAEGDRPRIAKSPGGNELPPATTAAPPEEPRRPPAPQADTGIPSPKVAPETVALAAPLNLPNRPASSRALKIGDSWTYRLREIRFSKNLATVTHEISGGDAGGIRETLSSGGSAQAATERRLPLQPRIFEQPLAGNATLFEFAPFMTAFAELQPGVTWTKIAGAASSDSVNDWRFSGKVTGRERVSVPAGNFDAIKAELEGNLNISAPSTINVSQEIIPAYQTYTIWFVPEVGREVKYVRRTYNRARLLLDHEQYELVSYQLK